MLMQLYKNEPLQDYTFEEVLNNSRLNRNINTKLHSKIRILLDYNIDIEDIKSEIDMSLWKCYKNFNLSKGYMFSTYALHIANVDIQRIINYYTRGKRNALIEKEFKCINSTVDGSEDSLMLEEMIDNGEMAVESVYINSQCKSIINEMFANSDEYEKDLFRCMLGYITLQDLSDKYGKTKMAHSNRIKSIRETCIKNNSLLRDMKPYIEHKNTRKVGNKKPSSLTRKVEIFQNGVSLGRFESIGELHRSSEEKFGTILNKANIREAVIKSKQYKGYTFVQI